MKTQVSFVSDIIKRKGKTHSNVGELDERVPPRRARCAVLGNEDLLDACAFADPVPRSADDGAHRRNDVLLTGERVKSPKQEDLGRCGADVSRAVVDVERSRSLLRVCQHDPRQGDPSSKASSRSPSLPAAFLWSSVILAPAPWSSLHPPVF